MAIAGAPAALKVGGAVATGPAPGIYRVKVGDASTGASSQKGTPFLQLDLTVHKDEHNPSREGKLLTKARFYLAKDDEEDAEKVKTMKGMMKRGPYAGFNVPWPKDEKNLDVRQFVGKEAFVLLAPEKKRNESDDDRNGVRRIAQKREDLEPQTNDEAASNVVEKPKAGTRR